VSSHFIVLRRCADTSAADLVLTPRDRSKRPNFASTDGGLLDSSPLRRPTVQAGSADFSPLGSPAASPKAGEAPILELAALPPPPVNPAAETQYETIVLQDLPLPPPAPAPEDGL
jgi:hypothetical protein